MQPTPAPNSQVIPPLPLKCSRLNRYNHPFDALQATVDYSVDRVVAALSQPYPATSCIRQNKSRRPYSSARQVLQCFELIDHPESTPSSRSRQKARELVPLTLGVVLPLACEGRRLNFDNSALNLVEMLVYCLADSVVASLSPWIQGAAQLVMPKGSER